MILLIAIYDLSFCVHVCVKERDGTKFYDPIDVLGNQSRYISCYVHSIIVLLFLKAFLMLCLV